ncbi:MAG TPA: glycosyltransferase family 39 protein [Candidatus Hydrogenedentes bacterium]|nr:glycosyltransferase family 39 protein [Candidatus Hydrogenedentota bacterium]
MPAKHPATSTLTPEERARRISLVVLFVVLLVISVVRIRLAPAPLERDEGEYAYAGQLLLHGVLPFDEMYNMKMPGIYVAYAAILAVFGQSVFGIHLGLLVVNAGAVLFLYALTRRYLSPPAAVAAAGTFGWISLSSGVLGAFAHATQFVVFFGLAGLLVLMHPGRSVRWTHALGSGLLFGVAFMMKQHAAPFIVVAGVYLIWRVVTDDALTPRARGASIVTFGAGVFAPFLATCGVLWAGGVFDTFWFWTFDYAGAYVAKNNATRIPENLGLAMRTIVPSTFLILILSLVGLVAMWKQRRVGLLIGGMLIAACIAVSPGFYFRTHYFVLMLPVLAVLCALGAEALAGKLPATVRGASATLAALGIVGVAWGQYALADRAYLLTQTPVEVSRTLYSFNPFPESLEVARYLREHTGPEDRIAVIGSEPQICFYAQRRSVSGFAYIYPLMEDQPFAAEMQQQMIGEIENGAPKYAVLISVSSSWNANRNSDLRFMSWAQKYLMEKCERVGLIDITEAGTAYYWDEKQRGRQPISQFWIGVYRVKENSASPTTPAAP